jgi:hypothetical protein
VKETSITDLAALDVEKWKYKQKGKFQNQLNKLEQHHMNTLSEEWNKREKLRENEYNKKLSRISQLEEELKKNLEELKNKQDIKSKINQSKTENTIDKKVKVEEENVLSQFKNECENQFIECTDEQNNIVTTSYQSQKRKRNENPIIEEKQW